jgi:hypothetical protein
MPTIIDEMPPYPQLDDRSSIDFVAGSFTKSGAGFLPDTVSTSAFGATIACQDVFGHAVLLITVCLSVTADLVDRTFEKATKPACRSSGLGGGWHVVRVCWTL